MSKLITSCNHDPDFTICTECQKVNKITDLLDRLEAAEAYKPVSVALMRDNIALRATIAAISELPDKWRDGDFSDKVLPEVECAKQLQAIIGSKS